LIPSQKALNLTPAQKFTIVTIASASMNSTEPLFDQLKQWWNSQRVFSPAIVIQTAAP